jgi:hypothetical protein
VTEGSESTLNSVAFTMLGPGDMGCVAASLHVSVWLPLLGVLNREELNAWEEKGREGSSLEREGLLSWEKGLDQHQEGLLSIRELQHCMQQCLDCHLRTNTAMLVMLEA